MKKLLFFTVFALTAINLSASEQSTKTGLTLFGGNIACYPTLSALSFKLGTSTCNGGFYLFGIGGTAEVKTKNLLIATAVAVALTVAYKKGYFGAIKNYFMKSSDQDEDEHAV